MGERVHQLRVVARQFRRSMTPMPIVSATRFSSGKSVET
jgi:hypothetical protein